MSITLFDLGIFTITAISTLLGLYRGFTYILVGLASTAASIIVAIILYPYLQLLLIGYIKNQTLLAMIAGTLAYLTAWAIFSLIEAKINVVLASLTSGLWNRAFGMVLGAIRGICLGMVIFAVCAILSTETYFKIKEPQEMVLKLDAAEYPQWLATSITTPYLEKALKRTTQLLPNSLWSLIKLPKNKTEIKSEDEIELLKDE